MSNRPTKGQKAQSIIDKEKRNRDTVKKRLVWLRNVYNEKLELPKNFDALTLDSFCKYENIDLGFTKLSINTFKTHIAKLDSTSTNSNNLLLEVKDILTSLRRAKTSPKKTNNRTTKKDTILYYKNINKGLNDHITLLTDDLLTLRIGYLNLLDTLENSQVKNKIIQQAIKTHREAIGLRLVPNYNE